jgi:branched-chain amino acid transport system substrate-binding protein
LPSKRVIKREKPKGRNVVIRCIACCWLVIAVCGHAASAYAQELLIANVAELSGGGASNGVNWKQGLELATDEINAKGGILGRKLTLSHYDTQTNVGVTRAMIQKSLDEKPFAIMGPIYSGPVKASMNLSQDAKVPQFVGAQAGELTELGSEFLFRANISQVAGMEKVANYMRDGLKAKRLALVWVNNDFGKGGRDALNKMLASRGIELAVDIPIEYGQMSYAVEITKIKAGNVDVVFPYMTVEDTARFMLEAKRSGIAQPLVGETTLLQQNVLDLVGAAADGARSHLSLSADAPAESVQAFRKRFEARFKTVPDHNAISSYTALYALKFAAEKAGKTDGAAVAAALHGLKISVKDEPNILLDSEWNEKGDLRRASFIGQAEAGKLKIIGTLE